MKMMESTPPPVCVVERVGRARAKKKEKGTLALFGPAKRKIVRPPILSGRPSHPTPKPPPNPKKGADHDARRPEMELCPP